MQNQINQILETISLSYESVEYIKEVKSGKEASVFLLLVDGIYMALKVYRENQKYSTRTDYLGLNEIQDSRQRRAIKNRTKKGNSMMENEWTQREFKIMQELFINGADVPEVFMRTSDSILMQYIGSGEEPAPRLSDINLDKEQSISAFKEIIKNVKVFLDLGFVHGDLSSYNILWHEDSLWIIDFPQIIFVRNNPNAKEKFHKDLDNIYNYFSARGVIGLDKEMKSLLEYFYFIKNN